ncbi:nucleotide exchange factor GrpE [Candidatus Kuenenia sp.]|uniref:nucleotide exchange factor GrpE n=1 Tax=Candidatus Kuenenia sp. TaxID=2499824 RepID=UPI00321FDA36
MLNESEKNMDQSGETKEVKPEEKDHSLPDTGQEGKDAGDFKSEAIEVVQSSEVLFAEQQAIVQSLKQELDESKNKIGELQHSIRRLAADFDNYKKWVAKERQIVERTATESLIKKLLDIYESLEKAAATDDESVSKEFKEGIKLIYKEFSRVLKSEGLEPIKAEGTPLDVCKHEVLMQMLNDEAPENTILQEIQKGYFLNSLVLRPAKVVVSQKSQKEETQETENTKNQEEVKGE